jgi:hypothetical protein
MFYLWWRRDREWRQRVWNLFGWYCGLMLCSSLFGIVTWSAWMVYLENFFKGNTSLRQGDMVQGYAHQAVAYSWLPVITMSHAIVVPCASAAKLMVLDRMSELASSQEEGMRRRWTVGGRVVMAVVVALNAAGLAATIYGAPYYQKVSDAMNTASMYYAVNNSDDGIIFRDLSAKELQNASSIRSVQSFCEVTVLLLIVATFLLAGLVSARRISFFIRGVEAASPVAAAGRMLKFRLLFTTVCVFAAFLLRSVVATMFATGELFQSSRPSCPGDNRCDAQCYNIFTLMWQWMIYTPEFLLTTITLSSPLALLVALWGTAPRVLFERQVYEGRLMDIL